MILIDYNQILLANLFVMLGGDHTVEIEEDLIRHMFLNSLRGIRKKHHREFGEVVICTDSKYSWRRDVFEYYKAARRKSKQESDLDWSKVHEIMGKIIVELDEHFPYKVIKVDKVEADDIIGTIAHRYGRILNDGSEKILIVSTDKDYIQLHKYGNVKQWNPVRNEFIVHSDPVGYLREHVHKGDRGDGIPNILSPDNCFVVGIRQTAMTKKKLEKFYDEPGSMDEGQRMKYERNRVLIDLEFVPEEYKEEIIEQFEREKDVGRGHLMNYFIKNRLKNLLEDLGDF